ncbi:NlpC/P60 family protein [Streptomyces sp. NPDC007084]|uniref:C40 family peptidase n=1 Tax=Streptomyces sp. NPDC007084 TaxID=3154313 RepID=UPI003451FEF7
MAPERTQPSGEEVRRRLASLYDRAEDDTGNFNATRALASLSRQGDRRAVARRLTGRPPAVEERRAVDPAQDDLMRQWFDGARSRLGPTVAAVLPADRRPDRGREATRRAGERSAELPAAQQLSQGALPAAESTAAAGRELTAGPAAAPVAELTARPVLELTAGPVSEPTTWPTPAIPDQRSAATGSAAIGSAATGSAATGSLPAVPGPALPPETSSPRFRKDRARRKLAAAQEMLARHTARRTELDASTPAAYPPVEQPFGETALPSLTYPAAEYLSAPAGPGTYPTTEHLSLPVAAAAYQPMESAPWQPTGAGNQPATRVPDPVGAVAYQPLPDAWSASPAPVAQAADDTGRTVWPAPVEQPAPGAPWSADPNAGFDTGSIAAVMAPPVTGYDTRAAEAVAFARAQVGRPCVWGASGPGSFDPSGLTQAAWRSAGVLLPRTAGDQARIGPAVPLDAVQPGDLLFFHEDHSHVGLYVGDGLMVHAPRPGGRITEEPVHPAGQATIHTAVRPV